MTKQLQQEMNAIVGDIVTQYQPEKIILFGSAVRGETTQESDLDICIVKDTKKPFFDRLQEAHGFVHTDRPMDIIVLTPAEFQKAQEERRMFIRHILTYGLTLYDSATQPS